MACIWQGRDTVVLSLSTEQLGRLIILTVERLLHCIAYSAAFLPLIPCIMTLLVPKYFKPPPLPPPVCDAGASMTDTCFTLQEALRRHLMVLLAIGGVMMLCQRLEYPTVAKYCFFVFGIVLGSSTMLSLIMLARWMFNMDAGGP